MQQSDNMVPVLFLFLMMAFAETLKIVWRQQEIPILSVMTTSKNNLIDGKICSHTLAMFTLKKLAAYEILQSLYVDDGAFPFGTRRDLKNRMELIYHHFDRLGLEHPKVNAFSSLPPSSSNTHSNAPQWLEQSNRPSVTHMSATTQQR